MQRIQILHENTRDALLKIELMAHKLFGLQLGPFVTFQTSVTLFINYTKDTFSTNC